MNWFNRLFAPKVVPGIVHATYDGVIMEVTWSDGVKEKYTGSGVTWYRLPEMRQASSALELRLSEIEKYIQFHKKPYDKNDLP